MIKKVMPPWPKHTLKVGQTEWRNAEIPKTETDADQQSPEYLAFSEASAGIEPWLTALFQADHLNVLIGSGLATSLAIAAAGRDNPAATVDMTPGDYTSCTDHAAVAAEIKDSAGKARRGTPNLEDAIRVIREHVAGLKVLARAYDEWATPRLKQWSDALRRRLSRFVTELLQLESSILDASTDEIKWKKVLSLLSGFLLSLSSRTATRERVHFFTTNYDRLIEFGCDLIGLHLLDRFVGRLTPVFRASRLGLDMHYNPPGIRGEPRYLEGVVRLTKLHGSIDWRQEAGAGWSRIVRQAIPFGGGELFDAALKEAADALLIYPNPAKDMETLGYPYAEMFRDFAAATCQPNAALVTYGYGFGDDHINRVIRDMLTIPSTHVAIISYDDPGRRIQTFVGEVGREDQITLLIGDEFGALQPLVEKYLPKQAIDKNTMRMIELMNRRHIPRDKPEQPENNEKGGKA